MPTDCVTASPNETTCEACKSKTYGYYDFNCRVCEARAYTRAPLKDQQAATNRWKRELSAEDLETMKRLIDEERQKR